jgi:sirohydrochlorin cobaltochelatase
MSFGYPPSSPLPTATSSAPLHDRQRALLLVAHGSQRRGAGAALLRLAERARAAGLAPIVEVAFLKNARPTVGEALARCVRAGAAEVTVLPYFLTANAFVREELPRVVVAARAAHPALALQLAEPLGSHPALAQLLLKRAAEADYLACHAHIVHPGTPRPLDEGADWRPLPLRYPTSLLIIAHGSTEPYTNAPIYQLARRIRSTSRYASVQVCFMSMNRPTIGSAIDMLAARGIAHIIAVPLFLHHGNHVERDVPAQISSAQARNPTATILLSEHLEYDRLLLTAIADRAAGTKAARSDTQPVA